jgi:two-component system, cell cycle sensor histidine kinase and response regulator CckA
MTRPLRVLHLEDNARDAEMVRHKLDTDGVSCDILLVNRQEAFEAALAREPFDLILSDYSLPAYDGVAALEHAQRAQPHVPVIIISGTVGEEEGVRLLHLGATDYLLKGRLDRLGAAVQRAIHEAQGRVTRGQVEIELTRSEQRKAAILDSVLDCIITMDAHGVVIEFNAAAERTFGYTKAEAIGRPLADLIIPPALRAAHTAGLARYLATGEERLLGKAIEMTAVRADGSELPVELAITAIHSEKAPIFTAVMRDITGRKKFEAELRQAEAAARGERDRAQRFLDTANVILLALDLTGRITLINRFGSDLLGWTEHELLGREFVECCLPARFRVARRAHFQTVIKGDLTPVEAAVLTRSGEERMIEWRNTLVRDNAGDVVGTFSSGTDITERTHAVDALRGAEERTQFVLQNANVGVWDMDHKTGVLRWSGTMEAQYGLPPGTFDGRFDSFIEGIHPGDRASVIETIGKALTAGGDFSVLNRALWPDGTVRWLSSIGRILLGEGGTSVRAVGVSLDVTERRTLEQQFQQAQKMEAIGQLAGGVAHDFNNLLTVILGFCELLLADLNPDDPRQTDITEIQHAGMRAAGLTRQLLAFSRKQIIEPTRLDLNEVVTGMQGMLRRLIREDVKVVLSLASGLAPVTADRGEVEQIVMNLAVNARDAMPKGGILTIETANVELDEHYAKTHLAVAPGPYVALTLTDTGTGMTPAVQARLFEPFFTTKAAGEGTGLGMATVYGIVTRSGGSVGIDSEVGRGTSFKVYFPPAAPADLVEAAPATQGRPAVGTQIVLLVEDEEGVRELTRRLLVRQGYTVLVAADADEATRIFEANPSVDVLLTDVVMPGASGPELVGQLVARRPALKVIYMSGYTDEAIVHHGVLKPGIAFLHKPFTSETLGRKIRDVIDR